MSTVEQFISKAAGEIGNNGDKYNKWYWEYTGPAWCAAFLSWVADQVGLSGYKSAAVSGIYAVLPKVTTRSLDGVERGDFVCYNWDNRSATDWMDHIGVVEWVNSDNGEFGTIEGNTTDTLGGLVARRTRTVKSNYFTAFCRPGYTVSFLSTIADAVRKAAEIAKEGVQPQKFTGEYTIQNVGSGKMLNVFATPSSVKQGSEVRACNKDGSPEQRFRMDSSGSGKYHITSLINSAGYCIDTYGTPSTLVSGAKVHVWTPSASGMNIWSFESLGNDCYVIRSSLNASLVLTATSPDHRANVIVQTYSSSNNLQKWKLMR
jgi:hypothetical protein